MFQYFKGAAGEQERPPQQLKVARLSPLQVHCCISLLQRRVRMKAVQVHPVLNAGNTDERVRAAGDDNSTQAADGEE